MYYLFFYNKIVHYFYFPENYFVGLIKNNIP